MFFLTLCFTEFLPTENFFHIVYEDGDEEDLSKQELLEYLSDSSNSDGGSAAGTSRKPQKTGQLSIDAHTAALLNNKKYGEATQKLQTHLIWNTVFGSRVFNPFAQVQIS